MVTLSELQTTHKNLTNAALHLVEKRGNEYAFSEDTLATFKNIHTSSGFMPSKVALILLHVKMARLNNQVLRGNQIPYDTILDLINYTVYLYSLMLEEEQYNEKTVKIKSE